MLAVRGACDRRRHPAGSPQLGSGMEGSPSPAHTVRSTLERGSAQLKCVASRRTVQAVVGYRTRRDRILKTLGLCPPHEP
jgi:hypothetical protein